MALKVIHEAHGERWACYHADAIDCTNQLPDHCVDFSLYSPPFASLFTYSDSLADMGNSSCDGEFAEHYRFLAEALLRVTKPGRLCAVHCSDLPTRKWTDGVIGLKDFSGELIRIHTTAGWIYHSRITVWRDPVVEMQRTKALGLLHKQLKKDSSMSRVGMPDYVVVFRAPGENPVPISHKPADFPVERWQQWASPVWMDIEQGNVLNGRQAREIRDERHICPLQLDLIERAVTLWSNPGEVVFSPFAGIGSEGHGALLLGRRFVGIELKESYWQQAVTNLRDAEREALSPQLFAGVGGRA